jgi:hypothetical protein
MLSIWCPVNTRFGLSVLLGGLVAMVWCVAILPCLGFLASREERVRELEASVSGALDPKFGLALATHEIS